MEIKKLIKNKMQQSNVEHYIRRLRNVEETAWADAGIVGFEAF